jgi:hypothetical protein
LIRSSIIADGRDVNLRLITTILVITAAPFSAHAQKPTLTKADAQKVFEIISGDKAKIRIYCEMTEVGEQMAQANEPKEFDRLFQKMYELGRKLGPEYSALIEGLEDIQPESEVGQEISSTLDALDNLCRK